MENRILHIDFIKGVIIFLMVMFHIHYVDTIKPLTLLVYSFHMPVFLFLSGLFINTNKNIRFRIFNIFRSLFIPYVIFEFIYILLLYIAGRLGFSFQNNIDNISTQFLLYKIFLAPIGAYWYLHTLIICLFTVHFIDYFFKKSIDAIIITGLSLYILCLIIDGLKFENCIFILIGYNFQKFKIDIPLSVLSLLPFILISFIYFETIKRGTIESIGLVFLSISFLGWVNMNSSSSIFTKLLSHAGRNTLIIVLLHPIFLNIFRVFYKTFLLIDPSGLIYVITITFLSVILSIVCSIIMDKLELSKIIFGKKIYIPIPTTKLSLN